MNFFVVLPKRWIVERFGLFCYRRKRRVRAPIILA
jgi:hypothetical protein